MPKNFYAVVERFPGGTNVLLHSTLEKAEKRFKVILVDNLDPDEEVDKKVVDDATKKQYWDTCKGDSEQEIILEIQTLTLEK